MSYQQEKGIEYVSISVSETSRPANKRRKRKGAAAPAGGAGGGGGPGGGMGGGGKKRSPAGAPNFSLASQVWFLWRTISWP